MKLWLLASVLEMLSVAGSLTECNPSKLMTQRAFSIFLSATIILRARVTKLPAMTCDITERLWQLVVANNLIQLVEHIFRWAIQLHWLRLSRTTVLSLIPKPNLRFARFAAHRLQIRQDEVLHGACGTRAPPLLLRTRGAHLVPSGPLKGH